MGPLCCQSCTRQPTSFTGTAGSAHAASVQPYATPCTHQVLFTREQIADKTVELGQRVSNDYADKRPVIMPILKVKEAGCRQVNKIVCQWGEGVECVVCVT